MNSAKGQVNITLAMGVFLALITLVLYSLGQRAEPEFPIHYIFQIGNILGISALVAFLSAFHAYLANLAENERRESENITQGEKSLFGDERDLGGRFQKSFTQFRKILLPILLFFISVLEVLVTSWVFYMENSHIHEVIPKIREPLLSIASVSGVSAFCIFIASKYCSGLGFESKKFFLRPISGYSLFSAFACFIGAVATLLFYWEYFVTPRSLTLIFCFFSYFLAIERIIIWVLDLYRPQSKQTDEIPIYESRILALFCKPKGLFDNVAEIIDYQFGFKISDKWIFGFIRGILLPFFLLQIISLIVMSCICYVKTHEIALVEEWGKDRLTELGPGVHITLPWPFHRVYRQPIERMQQIEVPDRIARNNNSKISVWEDEYFGKNLFLSSSFSADNEQEESQNPSSLSLTLVSVLVTIQFKIANPQNYYLNQQQPVALLRLLSTREIVHYLLAHDFHHYLKSGLAEMGDHLKMKIQNSVNHHQLGVAIVAVQMKRLQPPAQIAGSYREVLAAYEEGHRTRIQAEDFSQKTLAETEQESNLIIREAEGETALITKLAEVEKKYYLDQYEIYKKYPRLFSTRATMDALEEWLKDVRKIVATTGDAREVINLELKKSTPDLLSTPLE